MNLNRKRTTSEKKENKSSNEKKTSEKTSGEFFESKLDIPHAHRDHDHRTQQHERRYELRTRHQVVTPDYHHNKANQSIQHNNHDDIDLMTDHDIDPVQIEFDHHEAASTIDENSKFDKIQFQLFSVCCCTLINFIIVFEYIVISTLTLNDDWSPIDSQFIFSPESPDDSKTPSDEPMSDVESSSPFDEFQNETKQLQMSHAESPPMDENDTKSDEKTNYVHVYQMHGKLQKFIGYEPEEIEKCFQQTGNLKICKYSIRFFYS
jgi:hypothetical protein